MKAQRPVSTRTRFGDELTALRLERGLSLRAVARQAGVSASYLSMVVNGYRGLGAPPSDELVERVAQGLELDPFEAFADYRRRHAVEEFPDAIDRLYRRRRAAS